MSENMFKNPPKVIPVKEEDPDKRVKPVHPNFIKPPALLLGIGAVKSGKTVLINNICLRPYEEGFYGQDYFVEGKVFSSYHGGGNAITLIMFILYRILYEMILRRDSY